MKNKELARARVPRVTQSSVTHVMILSRPATEGAFKQRTASLDAEVQELNEIGSKAATADIDVG
jgi:hypothetical protein